MGNLAVDFHDPRVRSLQDNCQTQMNFWMNMENELKDFYSRNCNVRSEGTLIAQTVKSLVRNLKQGTAPGFDGITSEHLKYGHATTLYDKLASVYSAIIRYCFVPDIFTI